MTNLAQVFSVPEILVLCSDDSPPALSFLLTLLSKRPQSTACISSSSSFSSSSLTNHPRVTQTTTQPHSCSVCMRRLYSDDLEGGCDMCGGSAIPTGGRIPLSPALFKQSELQASRATTLVLIGHPACTVLSSLLERRNPAAHVVLIGTEGGEIERELLALAPFTPDQHSDVVFEGCVGECIARVMSLLQWEASKLPLPPPPALPRVLQGHTVGSGGGGAGAGGARKGEEEEEEQREREVRDAIATALAAAAGLGVSSGHIYSAEDDAKFFEE